MQSESTVCFCSGVSLQAGAESLTDLQIETLVMTGCGECEGGVQEILTQAELKSSSKILHLAPPVKL